MNYFIINPDNHDTRMNGCASRISFVGEPNEADAFLVFGGDGTMLRAIREHIDFAKPFIGVNEGTRGFLMNHVESPRNICKFLDSIKYEHMWLVDAVVETTSGDRVSVSGFNDIWIERKGGQTLKMRATVDGIKQPPLIVGDGMLFATPQGSTGYNRALRGKAISPGVPVLQVTPMSCMVNKSPIGSIILSDTSEVRIDLEEIEKRPARLFCDGVEHPDVSVKSITAMRGTKSASIGFSEELSFHHKVLGWHFMT